MAFLGNSFKKISENLKQNSHQKSKSGIVASGQSYYYLSAIVREYISEPDAYLTQNSVLNVPRVKVSNPEDYELMTRDSLIAYIIDYSSSGQGKLPVICYPFFPHLSLPIKTGEHVWLVKDENEGRDLYYWISRKVGVKQTEDLNYTHSERLVYIDEKLKSKTKGDLFEQVNELSESDFVSFENIGQDSLPQGLSLNSLTKDSSSYNFDFTSEPVPPLRKKCGDAVIQGSNNSHIQLTTEKFFTNSNTQTDFSGKNTQTAGQRFPFSPAIDMCVGRHFNELNELKSKTTEKASSGPVSIIKNKRGGIYEDYENYEINKISQLFDTKTFNPLLSIDTDATNCGSRVYLSNNCDIDLTFNSAINSLDMKGGPSLATYATHNRVIADDSLRLVNRLGKSFLDMDSEGKVRIQGKTKVELAVREDNEAPSEPYVLYSELKDLLNKILGDLAFYNLLIEQVIMRGMLSGPTLGASATAMDVLDQLRDSTGESGTAVIDVPDPDDPASTISMEVSTTFLGGNVTTEKFLNEITTQVNEKLPSIKIFGE